MNPAPSRLADVQRQRSQKYAILSGLFSQSTNQIVLGSLMVLFANDVLGFAPKRIASLIALLRVVVLFRVLLIGHIRRLGRIRAITLGDSARLLILALLIFLPAQSLSFTGYALLLSLFFAAQQLGRVPVWQPLLRDITTVSDRGSFFSRMRLSLRAVHATFMICVSMFIGASITEGQYKVLVGCAVAGVAFGLYWVRRIPDMPEPADAQPRSADETSRERLWEALRHSRLLRKPILMQVLWQLTVTPVAVVYLKQVLHIPANVIVLQQFAAMVGAILSFMVWGRIADIIGFRPMLVGLLLLGLAAAPLLLLAAPMPVPFPGWHNLDLSSAITIGVVLLIGLINGALTSGIGVATTSILHFFTRRKYALEEMTLYSIGIHSAIACSVLFTGWLLQNVAMPRGVMSFANNILYWDWFRAYLVVGKTLVFMTIIAMVMRLPNTRPYYGVSDFFTSLFDGPVRNIIAGRRVYDEEEDKRIGLARLNARRISPLHVETLVELCEDPSYDVKVETVRALATSGSDLAGEKLLDMLQNEEKQELADHTAWALGELEYAPAVDELIARLSPAYPSRIRAMAARALGKIGDPRAVEPIVEHLRAETDSLHVIASCNKALLRLEDRSHADLVFESLGKLTNREERYELMVLICEWLNIQNEWLLRSYSHASWGEALKAETERRSRRWRAAHEEVIGAFDRRDFARIKYCMHRRIESLAEDADPIVLALWRTLKETSKWQAVTTLATAWLLFER